ncbi:DUF3137 domain-containing protein [Shewanella litorisediminis]|uniref:DUF3137 domain-containing protein n=1 Tax=Shewanella litorisediminis TaxID=1173586 RepID=A0ABX7G3A1_9GAMM|nr:DUF3137 domain-containing protein [Shewanella litorisediminis]MCL2917297.1 DUF3137 domain-containing protein [Shewanella litorisediminis]QRH01767.1 DUF3137 domain-containing protein [Shewanella litorisediminis]
MATPDFSIPFEHRKPFAKHYQQHIARLCQKLEARRGPIVARRQARLAQIQPIMRLLWPGIMAGFGAMGLGMMGFLDDVWIYLGFASTFCIMLGAAALAWWADNELSSFLDEGIKELYPKVLSYFGSDFAISWGNQAAGQHRAYADYGILPTHDKSSCFSHLKGSHHGVPFEFFNVGFYNKAGKDKYELEFKGILLAFTLKKAFKGTTRVVRDGGFWLGLGQRGLDRVKLEDPRFEASFEVFASDQVEARYLLNPGMMSRLSELDSHFGHGLEACFMDNKLLIRLPSARDFFSHYQDHEQPIDFKEPIEDIFADLGFIFGIADELAVARYTGL